MALQIANSLKQLSSQEENRDAILESQTHASALVLFLTDKDERVRDAAISALYNLSESSHLRQQLVGVNGLVAGVKKMMINDASEAVRSTALDTYRNLQDTIAAASSSSSSAAVSASPSTSTEEVIYLDGLICEEERVIVEQALLSIKGVISFQIDVPGERATVRAKIPFSEIIKVLSTKTNCLPSLAPPSGCSADHDYLSDDEENSPNSASSQSGGWGFWGCGKSTAVVATGTKEAEQPTLWSRIGNSLWG
eukprot:CAMPEP_0201511974 /NCGR_PEP_ID=MMETSP0161_2-20130828/4331_1 /ASSEMBLY_ACC=CAM_ASM_000251 /TAXON_ID=180227 /ORGANISM="Neoparamoeba aestuarina, Strain SoJaBio B1-5/56/2" /LENGTH=251 /DNA_ID=CAMNT_0047907663 /DNA_START=119 /DNA_END=874 /DNA_ORIENTATION=+